MVAAPLILGGDLNISDQNNWRGSEQKIKFGGRARFKGGPKKLRGGWSMNIVGNGRHISPFLDTPSFLRFAAPF